MWSRSPTTQIVGKVPQASPFCPNIAATPDGSQVWFTLKDTGKTEVFDAQPPFAVLKTLDTGPITNHVNIVRNAHGQFAYVTIGGLNEVKVFRTDDFAQVATIPVGKLPHGIWPSGDGTRVYVGLENDDRVVAIDTLTNTVIATVPIGQAPRRSSTCRTPCPRAPERTGLQPLGLAGQGGALHAGADGPQCSGRRQGADQRDAVRSGADAGTGGIGRPGSSRSTPTCSRCRIARTVAATLEPLAELHDQSRGRGDRQRGRPDPPDRSGRHGHAAPLPGHHRRHDHGDGKSSTSTDRPALTPFKSDRSRFGHLCTSGYELMSFIRTELKLALSAIGFDRHHRFRTQGRSARSELSPLRPMRRSVNGIKLSKEFEYPRKPVPLGAGRLAPHHRKPMGRDIGLYVMECSLDGFEYHLGVKER